MIGTRATVQRTEYDKKAHRAVIKAAMVGKPCRSSVASATVQGADKTCGGLLLLPCIRGTFPAATRTCGSGPPH